MTPERDPTRRSLGQRVAGVGGAAHRRLRALSQMRFDDLSVHLVVPVGIVIIVAFLWTGQSGEAVASLLGAVLTALFAALTFRLLRDQDRASWLGSRPFLWCAAEQSTDDLRVVVGNRSAAPALDVQVLVEVTYAEVDAATSLPVCDLARGRVSALPPMPGRLSVSTPEERDVRTVAVFVLLGTQLGHACAFYYRLGSDLPKDRGRPYALEEMQMSAPSRAVTRRRRAVAGDSFDELIATLELFALPDPARQQLADIREYRARGKYAYSTALTVQVGVTADP